MIAMLVTFWLKSYYTMDVAKIIVYDLSCVSQIMQTYDVFIYIWRHDVMFFKKENSYLHCAMKLYSSETQVDALNLKIDSLFDNN